MDKTTPITGLSAAELRTLESFCVPRAFYLVLALLGCLDGAVKRDLLGVEYYSGRGWLTSAFQMVGDRFLPYDRDLDPVHNNILSALGLLCPLRMLLRVWEGGLTWSGQVCSTWVWLARSSTRRTWELPRGCEFGQCAREGNRMAGIKALFMCFCYARGLDFVVEQPASSLLWRHDALRHVAFRARELGFMYHQVSTFMSQFGAATPKPTTLTGNRSWLHALTRDSPGHCDEPSNTATVSVDENGRRHVTGDKTGALKHTQEYTPEFGIAVSEAYKTDQHTYKSLICANPCEEWDEDSDVPDAPWDDLDLEPLLGLLRSLCK